MTPAKSPWKADQALPTSSQFNPFTTEARFYVHGIQHIKTGFSGERLRVVKLSNEADKCGYNKCGEVVVRLLSPLWRSYQSCGEITLAGYGEVTKSVARSPVARLPC